MNPSVPIFVRLVRRQKRAVRLFRISLLSSNCKTCIGSCSDTSLARYTISDDLLTMPEKVDISFPSV